MARCWPPRRSRTAASAQEIQLTGPLAGAPAVRKMRLHRDGPLRGRAGVSFTLLDQYERTIMPGATLTYHITDWFGDRRVGRRSASSTTRASRTSSRRKADRRPQLRGQSRLKGLPAHRGEPDPRRSRRPATSSRHRSHRWAVAPQVMFVPFRGKLALFSALFVDTDVNLFVGAGLRRPQGARALRHRRPTATTITALRGDPYAGSSALTSRVAVAPTFGLGLNFYPAPSSASAPSSARCPSRGTPRASTTTAAATTRTSRTTRQRERPRVPLQQPAHRSTSSSPFPTAIKTTE